jgi:RimJ/RimL family protein N-acetyltransferase
MDRAFAAKLEADMIAKQASVIEQLRASELPSGGAAHAPAWPFKALWSESEGRLVGDVFLWPNTAEPRWGARTPTEGITEASVLALPAPEQSWMLGYALEPALYGRGVMSELLGCILAGWVKPVMGVGEVAAFIETDNPGSEAVARRNGFVWRREERTDWPEEKGGGVHVSGYYTVDMRS